MISVRAVSGLRADQRRNRRQRVEEEMRVDLVRQRLDAGRHQQLFLLLQAMLDARAVPDLDRDRDAEHRRERNHEPHRRARSRSRASRNSRLGQAVTERLPNEFEAIGAASSSTCQSISKRRTSRQACRCRPVKKNGEKCQIASFGQISRKPPPANPQPIANGRAIHSPRKAAGTRAWRRRSRPRKARRADRRETRPAASDRRRNSSAGAGRGHPPSAVARGWRQKPAAPASPASR